jgi:hypothetical protein
MLLPIDFDMQKDLLILVRSSLKKLITLLQLLLNLIFQTSMISFDPPVFQLPAEVFPKNQSAPHFDHTNNVLV